MRRSSGKRNQGSSDIHGSSWIWAVEFCLIRMHRPFSNDALHFWIPVYTHDFAFEVIWKLVIRRPLRYFDLISFTKVWSIFVHNCHPRFVMKAMLISRARLIPNPPGTHMLSQDQRERKCFRSSLIPHKICLCSLSNLSHKLTGSRNSCMM